KDTIKAQKAHKLANSLIESIQQDSTLSANSLQVMEYYMIAFDVFKANGLDQKEDAWIALNKLDVLLKKGDIIGDEYVYNLLDWKANLFLDMKQVDSASFYIEIGRASCRERVYMEYVES